MCLEGALKLISLSLEIYISVYCHISSGNHYKFLQKFTLGPQMQILSLLNLFDAFQKDFAPAE